MIIPHSALDADTLRNLIEHFVTSGASDEGFVDMPLSDRVARVQQGLSAGDWFIVFDEASESCVIVDKETAKKAELL